MSEWKPSIDKPSGESPLRRFKGNLKQWGFKDFEATESRKASRTIVFDFTDVEVIDATEPYPYPIAQIRVRYADPQTSRGGTRWAHFSESLRAVSRGQCEPQDALDWLVGKGQEWAVEPCEVRVGPNEENDQWHNELVGCWKVLQVEGVTQETGGNIYDYVVDLLNGKTDQDFHQALYQDAKIRSYPEIIEDATNRKLLTQLETMGLAKRGDDGVWVKVNGASGTTVQATNA